MPLRKKTETHEQKLARTQATKTEALAVFVTAADQLDSVKAEASEVYNDLDFEIERLRDLRDAADATAAEAYEKARQIRSAFLGG